jgi:hypothetical protein
VEKQGIKPPREFLCPGIHDELIFDIPKYFWTDIQESMDKAEKTKTESLIDKKLAPIEKRLHKVEELHKEEPKFSKGQKVLFGSVVCEVTDMRSGPVTVVYDIAEALPNGNRAVRFSVPESFLEAAPKEPPYKVGDRVLFYYGSSTLEAVVLKIFEICQTCEIEYTNPESGHKRRRALSFGSIIKKV